MSKVFVANKTGVIHTENRPDVGFVSIGPDSRFECFDVKDPKDSEKVVTTARELALSIINDSGGRLVLEEVADKPKVIERKVIDKIGEKAKVITSGKSKVGKQVS